jgi:hypothetical protein
MFQHHSDIWDLKGVCTMMKDSITGYFLQGPKQYAMHIHLSVLQK